MIFCDSDCIACCDFCISAIHDEWDEPDGTHIVGGPIGCNLWDDEKHQQCAENCLACPDFHCFRAPLRGNFLCHDCGEMLNEKQAYKCPVCGGDVFYPWEENRAAHYREQWINTRKFKCIKCGKWHWDISGWDYACECGSTIFEDRTGLV